jgi:hypothetical protein
VFRGLLAAAALLIVAMMVWQDASAAFSATTSTGSNSFTTGTVTMSSSFYAGNTLTFSNVQPGSTNRTGPTCVDVQFTGSLASQAHLYVTNYANTDAGGGTGQLGQLIDLTITVGSGTTCAAFGTATTLFAGTLDSLATTTASFASGLDTWMPAAAGAARPYRISYFVRADNAAQGDSATLTFVWQAQNL